MSRDAEVLNRLIARLHGAAAGYRKAGADGPGLSDATGGAADAHDRTAEELTAVLRATGATPAGSGVDLAGHAWADLPRAVTEGPRALAEAVERAEAELLQDFHAAMDDSAISGPVRDAIVRAFDGVKAGHDRALQWLDELLS